MSVLYQSVTTTGKWRTLKELKRKNISLLIFVYFTYFRRIKKKVQRVSLKYRKYLSFEPFPFLSSAINKVYLVGIIPVFFI